MKLKSLFILTITASLFASCTMQKAKTRNEAFEHFYNERPTAILMLPPINQTTNVDAKEYFFTTIHRPLADAGYYVLPPLISMEVLQNEGAYDSELFLDQGLETFGNVFQADIVLFPIIHEWKKVGVLGTINIDIEFIFKDVQTGEVIFSRYGEFTYNANKGSQSSLLGAVAANVVSAKLTDYVPVARKCVEMLITDMPLGKYHNENITDGKYRVRYGDRIKVNF
jgi:hypothetical protein